MTYMTILQHKNFCHGVVKFTILVNPSLVIIRYVPSLFDPCPREEKIKIFNQIMHFHYITYVATPKHKFHAPGAMKFTILVDPS